MRSSNRVGMSLASLLVVALGSIGAPASGGDSPAENVLKAKGLTRMGRVFVDAEAEKPALIRIKEVRAGSYAAFARAAEKEAEAEQLQVQAALLAEQQAGLQANLNVLNQQVRSQGSSGGRYGRMARSMGPTEAQVEQKQVQAAISQASAMRNAVKSKIPSAQAQAALEAEVKKKADAFKLDLAELRKLVDDVTRRYADLAADAQIKQAIADMEKAGHARISLGPSEVFHAGMKELDQAERQFLGKRPAAHEKKKSVAKAKK